MFVKMCMTKNIGFAVFCLQLKNVLLAISNNVCVKMCMIKKCIVKNV